MDENDFQLWNLCCSPQWGPRESFSLQMWGQTGWPTVTSFICFDDCRFLAKHPQCCTAIGPSLPFNLPHDHDFPILQYADDTLIFMQGDARQLFFLKDILNSFADSTGLKVNYSKSMMIPINLSDERFDILAQTFGCSKGTLPFTYLGLPLSLTRPTVADYWPLVSKCERRLSNVSSFLNEASRLEIRNAILSAMPTYTMCTFLLPKTVIKQIDKFRKHCL